MSASGRGRHLRAAFSPLLLLMLPVLAASALVAAQDTRVSSASVSVLGLAEAAANGRDEIQDPFFSFVLGMIDSDSLGTWSSAELDSFCRGQGKTSRLPLDRIVSIERRAARSEEQEERRGARVSRIWRVEMVDKLDVSVPYSILGYHPGSMRMAKEVMMSEWLLGSPSIYAVIDGDVQKFATQGLTVLRIDSGYVLLDADGWVDRLLGKGLDDSWSLGFAVGRVDSSLMGLGIAVGRKGRKLYGEFDFAEDTILTHGRPLARSVSHYTRPWTMPRPGKSDGAWQNED